MGRYANPEVQARLDRLAWPIPARASDLDPAL